MELVLSEYLDLTMQTLGDLSIQAGWPITPEVYEASLRNAASKGLLFEVRRAETLLGFATLKKKGERAWFVLLLVVHPAHRSRGTLVSLFSQIVNLLEKHAAQTLVSNVLRTNAQSQRFHERLGFHVTRENALGFEYTLTITEEVKSRWRRLLQVS